MKLLEEDEVPPSLLSLASQLALGRFSFRLPFCFSDECEIGRLQDESMHSGADVDAFQAALNRDIGGDASTSQHPSSGTIFSTLTIWNFFFGF